MLPLREVLLSRLSLPRTSAANFVSELPAYQVALWPDGWETGRDGSVLVRDTHAMAEARRWYLLAGRNCGRVGAGRIMAMYGVFVPRAIVDLANRRFTSERVASVAVELVAGDWVRQRRRQLLNAPASALRERSLGWSGSRHAMPTCGEEIRVLVAELLNLCVVEGMIPDRDYRVRVRSEDGYGVCAYRCLIDVDLPHAVWPTVRNTLMTALIPWNRAVVRDGAPALLVGVVVGA